MITMGIGQYKALIRTVAWLLCCLSLCVFVLGISWQVNKNGNFFYSFWYQQLDISTAVRHFSLENNFDRQDFVDTNATQHHQLFAQIVSSIHQHGQGLADISYKNAQGIKKTLLTENEIIHLQDVSQLISLLTKVWLVNAIILILFTSLYYFDLIAMPPQKHANYLMIMLAITLGFGFTFFGFTPIFYQLHTLIFPPEHQWFFYYQDSLMSTLMKAPDLFAAIALTLLLIAIPLIWIGYKVIFRHENDINTR